MAISREAVLNELDQIAVPGGGTLVSRDLVRALVLDQATIRFVIEVANADIARALAPAQAEAERRLGALDGVEKVQIVMTAPTSTAARGQAAPVAKSSGAGAGAPPNLTIGRHPTPQNGPAEVAGVKRILAIGSGKGGVGKSTVTSNLAVALARKGRKVGVLDADIYGPSQPRMLGITGKPSSDGQTIQPLHAHGVTVMSLGLMMKDGEAVVWRGPMLMGALQQMLTQVNWGELDVLLVDLPPGTGDVQLTLCQKAHVSGAIIVSTPQDVALIDARRAIDMFDKLKTPVLGLIENMSTYVCPNCGHEAHLFGHGGVAAEARAHDLPFLGEIPLELEVRLAGDAGRPIAAGEGAVAEAYGRLADRLIGGGMA